MVAAGRAAALTLCCCRAVGAQAAAPYAAVRVVRALHSPSRSRSARHGGAESGLARCADGRSAASRAGGRPMSAALRYTAFDNERDNVGVVQSVPWADLATQLADHKVGAKSGPCLACGTFNGTRAKTTVA